MKRWALSIGLCALSIPAYAQQEPGFPRPGYDMMEPGTIATARLPQLEDVTFKQRLNTRLPLDATFKDENGRAGDARRVLRREEAGRPCVRVLQLPDALHAGDERRLAARVKVLPFTAGSDFDVVFVSFDPRDKPETAAAEKKRR